MAELEARSGRIDEALAILDGQAALVDQTGEAWSAAEIFRVRGEVLLQRDPPDHSNAETALNRAVELARSQQLRTFELRASLSLAMLYQATGRKSAATAVISGAMAGFAHHEEFPEFGRANGLLARLEGAAAEPVTDSSHLEDAGCKDISLTVRSTKGI